MKKRIITLLLAIAWMVVGTHSSSAQAVSSTSIALEPGQGVTQAMLTAHCDIGHFSEVQRLNHISPRQFRRLRIGLPIALPASCSRPATTQERRNSWRALHGHHHPYSVRMTYRGHTKLVRRHHHHMNHRHGHRGQTQNNARQQGSQRAPAGTSTIANSSDGESPHVPAPAPIVRTVYSPFYRNLAAILAALLVGVVALGAILWLCGMRVFSKNRAMPKPLIVEIHGITYIALVSSGRALNKSDPRDRVWEYQCPIDGCTVHSLMSKEGLEEHLGKDHSTIVNIQHSTIDKSTRWARIKDRWRDRKWFSSWSWPLWPRD